jgi:hypothetical protein
MYKNQWICIAQCSSFPKTALSTLSISLAAVASWASYTAAGAGLRCYSSQRYGHEPFGQSCYGKRTALVCVCMYVCIYYVLIYAYLGCFIDVCMYVCMKLFYRCMYVCNCFIVFVCNCFIDVCMYVCNCFIDVCMYVCNYFYRWMYVCM